MLHFATHAHDVPAFSSPDFSGPAFSVPPRGTGIVAAGVQIGMPRKQTVLLKFWMFNFNYLKILYLLIEFLIIFMKMRNSAC